MDLMQIYKKWSRDSNIKGYDSYIHMGIGIAIFLVLHAIMPSSLNDRMSYILSFVPVILFSILKEFKFDRKANIIDMIDYWIGAFIGLLLVICFLKT